MKWPFTNAIDETSVVDLKYSPTISSPELGLINLTEQFKGEVEQNKVTFPTELGEEHPFDFKNMERLYKKFGLFNAIVDKYVDYIVGPGFYIVCDDARAKTILDDFMRDVNFDTILRRWTKEALVKGNGFLEIGGSKKDGVKGLKLLNANYMYVNRDKKGKILGYNQYKGAFDHFAKAKVIPFAVDNIAHVPFNLVGDCAYGLGIGYPVLPAMNNLLQQSTDLHKLMTRKANAPLHAKLGKVDANIKIIPKAADVTAFGKKMENMSNITDWATDDLINLSVVDFGNFGDKFSAVLEYDLDMLIYAFQIPAVLLGKANVSEGLAQVQMDSFQRRIQSMQAELEKIIEQEIFKRVLIANGLEVDVEFEWGTPSVMEVAGRMAVISELIKSPTTSMAMKDMLEDEMINMLKLDADEWEKLKLEMEAKQEEERNRLEAQAQPIVPGQNKSFPKKVAPKAEQPKQPAPKETYEPQRLILQVQQTPIEEQRMVIDEIKNNDEMINMMSEIKDKMKMLEDKRDEQIDNLKDDDIKDYLKQFKEEMQKLREEKDETENKLKAEIEDLKTKDIAKEAIPKKKKINKLRKRTSLLPPFRITRKMESIKINADDAIVVKFKRTEDTQNYEYNKECPHCVEGYNDINDINEWLGFNYKEYLGEIKKAVKEYDFGYIKALNEIELKAGYLSATQVEELRGVLDTGFKKGQGMKEMAKHVDKKVVPKDLYRMTAEGDLKMGASGFPILAKSADKRSIGIVRSEVTRLANEGAVNNYKKHGIKQVSWIASFGDRTCEQCDGLHGQIFEINNHPEIPIHPMCRCTISPVVELK